MSEEDKGTFSAAQAKAALEADAPVAPSSDLTGEALTLATASYDASMVTHNEKLTELQAIIDATVE